MDFKRIGQAYLKMRDARTQLKREYEAADEELKGKMEVLESAVLNHLNTNKIDSVRTEVGTFFRVEEIKPNGTDWDAFYKWIAKNDAFDALERRIKKTFITEYMEQHKDEDGNSLLPPGVSIHREFVARMRRN